jgi:hypothetical protein
VHALTRFFIVLAALLAVLVSALVMAYVANADAVAKSLLGERARLAAVEAAHASAETTWALDRENLNAQLAAVSDKWAQSQEQVRGRDAEIATLRAAKREAELEAESIRNQIASLSESVDLLSRLLKSYREEVTGMREAELRLRRNEIDLLARLSDLQAQYEVQSQSVRALQEEIMELRLAAATGAAPATGAVRGMIPLVRGRVVETTTDPATGRTLVRVDVGSNDQVRADMKLHVLRGREWLADLRVLETDLNWSIAEVAFRKSGDVRIQTDDIILSRLQ